MALISQDVVIGELVVYEIFFSLVYGVGFV